MALKRDILLILLSFCTLYASAQSGLVFESAAWDFGVIRESDGKVSHTFMGENRSDRPMVILDVITSCGCTIPEFSQKPILPGGKTEIKVTFDPANRPGSFVKSLPIYSSGKEKIATLSIHGNVLAREKSIEELYPIDAGGGLRLSSESCSFSYIYQERSTQSSIAYTNTSDKTITLSLQPHNPSGMLTLIYPHKIAPGERGEINLGYFISREKPYYGTVKDLLGVIIDGHPSRIQLLVHGIAVDNPDFTPDNQTPKTVLSKNIVKFGTVKHAAAIQRQSFTLTNEGETPLIIRAVETDGSVDCSLRAGTQLSAGRTLTAEVMLNPSELDYGICTAQITFITNDPQRPMRKMRVTAIIED